MQITDLLRGRKGVDMLIEEIKLVPTSAAAYAFIGTIVKEYGGNTPPLLFILTLKLFILFLFSVIFDSFVLIFLGVDECAMLFEKALELRPNSPPYVLNLVHVLEVCYDYQRAFKIFKSFMNNNKHMMLVSTPERTLTCKDVLEVIQKIEDINDYAAGKIYKEDKKVVDTKEISYKVLHLLTSPQTIGDEADPTKRKKEPLEPLTPDQLDLLAFYCTLVKVVYLVGALDLIQPLSERIGMSLQEVLCLFHFIIFGFILLILCLFHFIVYLFIFLVLFCLFYVLFPVI